MPGRLIVVVGPSGVGKDTLLNAARPRLPEIYFPTRVITRPTAAGGEVFEGVTPNAFARRLHASAFAFHWEANGLQYGIPIDALTALSEGTTVVFNASRAALPSITARVPSVRILAITAPPEALAKRLNARGRESTAQIANRLARAAAFTVLEGTTVIENDGTLEEGIERFLNALHALAEPGRTV